MAEPAADDGHVSPPPSEAEGAQDNVAAGDKRKRTFTKMTEDEKSLLEALLEQFDEKKV